jgi:Xaa-Pro dipeptidase
MSAVILECFGTISYLFRVPIIASLSLAHNLALNCTELAALWGVKKGGGVGEDSLDQLYNGHLQIVKGRTEKALAASGFDALVVHAGNPLGQFLDDQDYPFKVNPHFKAWLPVIDNPRCLLIYRPGNRPRVLFYQPEDYWHKPAVLPQADWARHFDWIAFADPAKIADHCTGLGRVVLLGPEGAFASPGAQLNPPDFLSLLHYERAIKTPYEVECMRRANALGAAGHAAALAAFRAGASEYGAHMSYLQATLQREEEMPYNNIVAYNEHAAVLHYQHLERSPPATLRSLLIDAGASYRGYAADITRTYCAAPGLFADLIRVLDAAQLRLCAGIVAGQDYREIHLMAHRALGDLMHEIGLINLPGQEALERGVTSVFFPHGIGHLLGLQVHDVGGVMADVKGQERDRPSGHPYLRLTRTLEPGVVVTVEPGIYFIDSLLELARNDARKSFINWPMTMSLRPFGGIRIEDNVVTTTSEPENLTRDAFRKQAA